MQYKTETYQFIADFIYQNLGIVYESKEYFRLDSRISTLLRKFQLSTEQELIKKIKESKVSPISLELLDLATNNETYFFRDQKPFLCVAKDIQDRLLPAGKTKLTIWSAGCSTGQEPYSLAMTLIDAFPNLNFTIKATDICDTALNKARAGVYSKLEVSRGLDPQRLNKYFEEIDANSWKISNRIKTKIQFEKFNLLSDAFPREAYDLIFCRNVLIYQNFTNREAIMHKLATSLNSDGLLFLGSGESTIGMTIDLKMIMINGAMAFKPTKQAKQTAA